MIVLSLLVASAAVSNISWALPSPALNAKVLSVTICIVSLLYVVSPVTVKLPAIVIVSLPSPIASAPPCDTLSKALAAAAAVIWPVPPFVIGTVSDKVEPAAVIVIGALPLKSTPLIALAVSRTVAEAALPLVSAAVESVCVVTNVCIWSAVAKPAPPFAIAAVLACIVFVLISIVSVSTTTCKFTAPEVAPPDKPEPEAVLTADMSPEPSRLIQADPL